MNLPTSASGSRFSPYAAARHAPTVSVVIACVRGRELQPRSLRWLVGECQRIQAEIIIAHAGSAAELASLRATFPTVRWVSAPSSANAVELREVAMAQCASDIVALANDVDAVNIAGVAALVDAAQRVTHSGS